MMKWNMRVIGQIFAGLVSLPNEQRFPIGTAGTVRTLSGLGIKHQLSFLAALRISPKKSGYGRVMDAFGRDR
jgi:hypothetical protein